MRTSKMTRCAVVIAVTASAVVAGGVVASAAPPSQFTVAFGDIRPARGIPRPESGTQASLWSAMSVATTTLTGSGRVNIGAIADNCQGSPIIRVTADGKVLGETTITDTKNYGSHPVGPALGAGTHKIKIQFVNQFLVKGVCDRNVHIGSASLLIDGSATTNAPTTGTPTTGTGATTGYGTAGSGGSTAAPGRPSGQAGPSNTGVPPGTKLTIQDGDLTITKPGAVIDGLDVRGFVDVRADNVTIKNTIIRGRNVGQNFRTLLSNFQKNKNLLVEDTTLVASFPSGYTDGLKGTNFTALRLNISKTVDTSLIFGDNVTVEDSWFHDNEFVTPWPFGPDNRTHSDNLQIQGGTNIKVIGNTFERAQNTAIIITQDVARVSNVQITDNVLSGGGCTVNIADKGKGPVTGLVVKDNTFGSSEFNCQMIVFGTATQPTVVGNVVAGTDAPIKVQQR